MFQRGKIRNRHQALQLRDFTGLKYGTITPTDIDGFIDFKNTAFVILETKYKNSAVPLGQKLALSRMCDAFVAANKYCIVLIGQHESNSDIDVANCLVNEYYYKKQWHTPNELDTIKYYIEEFLEVCGLNI